MGPIRFLESVFEHAFCTYLLTNARARLADSAEFSRSNFHWQPAIRKASAVVLVRDYDDVHRALILDRLIEGGLLEHRDYHVMNYAWTIGSYIPWHDDHHSEDAMTVYLNQSWEADWGGLFLYRDDEDQIRGIAPRFNCGLANGTQVRHATTAVTPEAPEPRFTLQLFSKRQP